jgi:phosphoribosylformylglycinamidine synthase
MGGASFASVELDEKNKEANKGAVQQPNPFLKRHLLVSTYDLFRIIKEKGYINKVSFKDMGAGGNVCSTIEQVAKAGYGADLYLDKIHVGMKNLHPSVVACAETQERFAWTCHPDLTKMILDHYNKKWDLPMVAENAGAKYVGKVRKGNYTVWFNGEKEADAPAKDLTEGLQYDRLVEDPQKTFNEPNIEEKSDYSEDLLRLLESENIASRRPVFEKYDKQVRGDTVVESGEADATILAPLLGEDVSDKLKKTGVALSTDGNPRYGKISPYYQGMNAVIESMRNVAAVGAYPIALTDCLNYGNPEKPQQMWEFVEGVRGIKDACEGVPLKIAQDVATPIISGNVSLYNESKGKAIAPSAVIACAGKIEDYEKAPTMQLKNDGDILYLLGARKNELGGSEFYRLIGEIGANVPKPDLPQVKAQIYSMVDAVDAGIVEAAHDISEGGMAVALAEMSFGGRAEGDLGVEVEIDGADGGTDMLIADKTSDPNLTIYQKLFSETGGFIVEVKPANCGKFEEVCGKNGVKEIYKIGEVKQNSAIVIKNNVVTVVDLSLQKARSAWWNGLRDKM